MARIGANGCSDAHSKSAPRGSTEKNTQSWNIMWVEYGERAYHMTAFRIAW